MGAPGMEKFEDMMKKVIARLQSELASLRTGRANLSLVEGIKVSYYGSLLPINQVANLSVADGRTLEIKPWDKEGLQAAEQAILKSDLGVTPLNDGKLLRIVLPAPTEERRKELVRSVKKQAEEFRVALRNVRRDALEEMKKSEKDKKISEDDLRRGEQDIQKLTDHYVKNVDVLLAAKEKEILEV
ncbi:MAG: ribosome recycling factor [Elusimicrobia bacterium RIFCSPLOWO2_01_FULL_64_13]|nr:MAG: ribosome recycling factor [Elusimicrobia bacterium RIFCSPHIGHO2_01_FULL_64_10]OGR96943.1 MAG: ribosome recycling factor [Elusimicrobia bacterium RIFCSPLOWO2_01_FULL_64_13]